MTAMTLTEKILARGARTKSVSAGQTVWVDVDLLMTHDVCGPGTIGIFHEQFGSGARVFDAERVIIIPDHYIFTADAKARRNVQIIREFAREQRIKHFYDAQFVQPGRPVRPYADPRGGSYRGVCHVTLAYERHISPGRIVLGTDSHTCTAGAFGAFATGIGNTEAAFVMGTGRLWLMVPPTIRLVLRGTMPAYVTAKDVILEIIGRLGTDGANYCAMEFEGCALEQMNIDERMTVCNMAVEAGAKNGIIPADEVIKAYLGLSGAGERVRSDNDAAFAQSHELDVSAIEPVVAKPHSPANIARAAGLQDVQIDRVYIGSCTGGKVTDLRKAAEMLAGRTVCVETFIVPATTHVDAAMDTEKVDGRTLRQIFIEAGCKIGPASCAACLGGPVDTFGRVNEPLKVVSTTNRNFPGRMGHKDAQIFLASPLTAAASAATGRITDPRRLMR